jgi:hypothetical protein
MTIYCDDFPTLEGDFDRHEGMGAVQQVGVGWKGGDKTPGESGGQWKACEMGFEIIRREIGKLEGQGWMNGGKEREGEEFPRVHACSTVDRPLESTAESTAPEKWPFLSNFRVLWPRVMASAVVQRFFPPQPCGDRRWRGDDAPQLRCGLFPAHLPAFCNENGAHLSAVSTAHPR